MSAPAIQRIPGSCIATVDPSVAPLPPHHRLPYPASDDVELVVEAIIPFDPVLDCGPVKFKLARRVKPSQLSPIARPLYRLFVRSLPHWWPSRTDSLKVPPAPKAELGIFDDWCDVVVRCKTPDHQINVMPANRAWPDDEITYSERSCRPLDTTDPQNMAIFRALCRMYINTNSVRPELSTQPQQIIEMLHRIETMIQEAGVRLRRIEEREGQHSAVSSSLTDGDG